MGQEDILNELVRRGDVSLRELETKFKPHGPITNQLKALRNKKLVDRKMVDKCWVYFPTDEALILKDVKA
jgi:DNA-binding HxlR family transcriptional regulator